MADQVDSSNETGKHYRKPDLGDTLAPAKSPGMSTDARRFADMLRRFRLAAALSQELLAERAGVSPRALSDLEAG